MKAVAFLKTVQEEPFLDKHAFTSAVQLHGGKAATCQGGKKGPADA